MITIIPKEEAPEILPVSRGRNTLLRVMLMQMKVGEVLNLPKEDWKTKRSALHYCLPEKEDELAIRLWKINRRKRVAIQAGSLILKPTLF